MNTKFKEIFGEIKDPRVERTKLHSLLDIIALGILGVMAGAQGLNLFKCVCHRVKRAARANS